MKLRRTVASLLFACLASLPVIHAQAAKPMVQELASGSALLVDLNTNEVLYSSNPDMVVPIASVTKLMTAMVVLDAKLPLDLELGSLHQVDVVVHVVAGSWLEDDDGLAFRGAADLPKGSRRCLGEPPRKQCCQPHQWF